MSGVESDKAEGTVLKNMRVFFFLFPKNSQLKNIFVNTRGLFSFLFYFTLAALIYF